MKHKNLAKALTVAMYTATALMAIALISILTYIVYKGIFHISWGLFEIKYTSENMSIMPALINTIYICILSLLLAMPVGLGTAVYIFEYSKADSKLIRIVRLTIQTLAGIPSIVYGLFGYLCFVVFLEMGFSVIAGAFTLAIMILPIIITTSEEAIRAVPKGYKEASLALGASKERTIFSVILPAAMSGILEGIILSIGRIIGESAALIYTAGTVAQMTITGSGRTLAIHMYALWSEGIAREQGYATAFILLIIVVVLQLVATKLIKRKRRI